MTPWIVEIARFETSITRSVVDSVTTVLPLLAKGSHFYSFLTTKGINMRNPSKSGYDMSANFIYFVEV